MRTIAIDFETYYDEDYSVADVGPVNYCLDPRFDAYMVAMYGDGVEFVGHPSAAPWNEISGHAWIAHNCLFEECVFDRLQFDGIVPASVKPSEWYDTMNLAFFCGLCDKTSRALGKIMKNVYGVELDKGVRTNMKGIPGCVLASDPTIMQYCLEDAQSCFLLWKDYAHRWPEKERRIAEITRRATKIGVPVNVERLAGAVETLKTKCEEAKEVMPWYPDKKPGSPLAFRETCEEHGLSLPKSTAKDDPEYVAFLDRHEADYPWIAAVSNLRKSNKMEKNLTKMIRYTNPSGRMNIGVNYHGAHTGRWSGEEVNLQGMNKEELFGIKMRETIEAAPGNVFGILDYAQIEPRTLMWRIGDEDFLRMVRSGMSPYEAHARLTMGWDRGKLKTEDPGLYAFAKMRFIALGYGMGAERFYDRAQTNPDFLALGLKVSMEEAEQAVREYRTSNPGVPKFWSALQEAVASLVGEKHGRISLPSGRSLNYYHIRNLPGADKWGRVRDQLYVSTWVGDRKGMKTWGGTICENCLAEGTKVLTSIGVVPIEDVTTEHKIWDGVDWVSCSGSLYKGEREVHECNGFKITGDHLIHDGNSWKSWMDLGDSGRRRSLESGRGLVLSLLYKEITRELEHYAIVGTPWSSALESLEKDAERKVAVRADTRRRANADFLDSLRMLDWRPCGGTDTRESCLDATIQAVLRTEITGQEVSKCLIRGGLTGMLSSRMPQLSTGGTSMGSTLTESTTTEITSPVTLGLLREALTVGTDAITGRSNWTDIATRISILSKNTVHCGVGTLYGTISQWAELPEKHSPFTKLSSWERVYDLVDCGPRNRFVVISDEGALLVHNCIQATDRDVLAEAVLRVEDETGLIPVFTAHDEAVYEIPEKGAEEKLLEIKDLMTVTPDWAKGLPLEVECFLSKVYKK